MLEKFFQQALDRDNEDSAARLLFSEWLAERRDARAAGCRYLAETCKHPYRSYATWEWWNFDSANPEPIRLPSELWDRLPIHAAAGYPRCKEWRSRRKAEAALCGLFARKKRKRANSR
jgi:hypothetical protein